MAARPAGPPGLGGAPSGGAPSGPPLEAPPPAPPGLFQSGTSSTRPGADDDTLEKQREISSAIMQQVQLLLEQARLDTEAKVKTDLKAIHEVMGQMNGRLDQLIVQLDTIEPSQPPAEAPLDEETVGQLLSKIEQQWGQEIRTLKEELHQTILAHNHNADLIKHHKDTIDALRDRCARLQSGGTTRTAADIQAQLSRLDTLPKQHQTQQKLEPLFKRLAALEQRVATEQQRAVAAQNAAAVAARSAAAAAWGRYPGMPPMPMMPPGMRGPLGAMGMSPAAAAQMMASMGTAGLMTGKGGQRPKGAAAAAAAAAAAEEEEEG